MMGAYGQHTRRNRDAPKRVLAALVVLTVGTGRSWGYEFAGGTGEPNDPYVIATAEQLLRADFSVAGTCFRLCGDIDLDRKALTPGRFRAHLDGAGFEIQNAAVVMDTSLFGWVEPEGTIENVALADLDLGMVPWSGRGAVYDWVGGLAAENRGTISNCHVTGWIATWKVLSAGGVVGYNKGAITNCSFDGWVSTDWDGTDASFGQDPTWVGGLVSYNAGSITNSFAQGIVIGRLGVGGLAGANAATIDNCYAGCWVLGEIGAGGLVAYNSGSLRKCYALGLITGQMKGGLVGMGGIYDGSATGCLWDTWRTDCPTSGTGVGIAGFDGISPCVLALNGWSGDPNWVIVNEFGIVDNYPRLAWEGTEGEAVPEPPFFFCAEPWEGSGTESDPYVIKTRDGLVHLCTASIYWDKHFVLGADLNMGSDPHFSPIGTGRGSSFSGTFDGNGHVIRNVTFGDDEATAWNLGLFGYVTGEIKNLQLEDIRLKGGANSQRVGLLAGSCYGAIRCCSVSGSIVVGENSRFVGGLIGTCSYGEVSDCQATVVVEAGEGSTDVGELIGAARDCLPAF